MEVYEYMYVLDLIKHLLCRALIYTRVCTPVNAVWRLLLHSQFQD